MRAKGKQEKQFQAVLFVSIRNQAALKAVGHLIMFQMSPPKIKS
jgi:hypothetical protein